MDLLKRLIDERIRTFAAESSAHLDADERDTVLGALEVLTYSARREAGLNTLGAGLLGRQLSHRLDQCTALLESHGAQGRTRSTSTGLGRTVIISGAPRTGTTLLHHLLSASSGAVAPSLAWMLYPRGDEATQMAYSRGYLDMSRRMSPDLSALHPMGPTWPDECIFALENLLLSPRYAMSMRAPAFLSHLEGVDPRPVLAIYLRMLRFRYGNDRHPPSLILKAPTHSMWIDAFADLVTDLVVVTICRDESEWKASWARLMAATMRITDSTSDGEYIDAWIRWLDTGIERLLELGTSGLQVLRIRYDDLVQDPVRTVHAVTAEIGIARPSDSQVRSISTALRSG